MAEIFISHATKTWQPDDDQNRLDARAIRDRVYERLSDSGHTPLLDQRSLELGDRWCPKLKRWMGQCHGALVIIDEKALTSDWLGYEAHVLSQRGCLEEERFLLITVVVGGLTSQQLAEANLQWLGEFLRLDATNGVEATVDKLFDTFAAKLVVPADRGPYGDWAAFVAHKIKRGAGGIDAALRHLGEVPADVDAFPDREVTLAHALLHAKPVDVRLALELLWLGGLDEAPGTFLQLVELLRPLCVDADAATCFRRLVDETPRQPAVIDAREGWIGRLYLASARQRPVIAEHGIEIDPIHGEGEEEIDDYLSKTLVARAGPRANMSARRHRAQESGQPDPLYAYFNQTERFFLLVGSAPLHSSILSGLRESMPEATFILLPGFDDAESCACLHRTSIVTPRLNPAVYASLAARHDEFNKLKEIAR